MALLPIEDKLYVGHFHFFPNKTSYLCISGNCNLFYYFYLFIFFQFEDEPGPGSLLILYSAVFTRGIPRVKADLDIEKGQLVTSVEEGSHCIVTLMLTGRATPYLHNGVVYVGDEDHYAMPQFGILTRSEVGFLVWDEGAEAKVEESRQPGSRLKTPSLPVWVTSCAGHYGVLFNTNRELLRNYHAERRLSENNFNLILRNNFYFRFDLHYYSCGGSHNLLSIDTRYEESLAGGNESSGREDHTSATPLEKLIHTKWQDAHVHWTGQAPVA
ncbi:hypothetical protein L9F63_021945 [Diploptera punctata]|uniref:Ubiquitin carboxyl-terminal hydrolase MINDY n=1 Tax=Diploptera punctata TaxID=6984 RepID=A0AAD8EBF3_DIPPU|nr:hypothetical protein L9F63_021945 [Diploptera punctata]